MTADQIRAAIRFRSEALGLTVRLADGSVKSFATPDAKADYLRRRANAEKSGRYDAVGGLSPIVEG